MLDNVRQCQTVAGHVSIVFWYIIFSVNNNICQTMSDNAKHCQTMSNNINQVEEHMLV